MNKYEPLGQFLSRQKGERVPMTFEEVEKVIGAKLPRSAYEHRPWWANDATGHAHAKAWLKAGFVTERVEMEKEKLVFARSAKKRESGMAESKSKFQSREGAHPIIGALKGLLWIDPTLDLTKPALDPDEWEEILNEKFGKDEQRD